MTPPLKLAPMETIHEINTPTRIHHLSPGMPGAAAEAMMFTVRSNHFPSRDGGGDLPAGTASGQQATGRSASMKLPVGRKASFRVREWMRQSNTSGKTKETTTTPIVKRPKITHLGGGRISEEQIEHAAPREQSLAGRRVQRSRASSLESRRTQWLDFYSDDLHNAQFSSTTQPKTEFNPDIELRPLPLRVPSLERERSPDANFSQSSNSNSLTRKNSKWKALPSLPAPPSTTRTETRPAKTEVENVANLMEKIILEPEPQSQPAESLPVLQAIVYQPSHTEKPSSRGKHAQHDLATPPPTPDSNTDGATVTASRGASTPRTHSRTKSSDHHPERPASPRSQRKTTGKVTYPQRTHSLRHTRQERAWLHANYRGEAPFLQAWGLDISRQKDREEGLALMRELMHEDLLLSTTASSRSETRGVSWILIGIPRE
ncbi:hypothetical protein QBC35DRAFT_393424 [Podospora australis]|uniref:Uncharacterized protein n=1 Tax=Podospora australis TaxID=1536484 RepID=A0AAN6WKT2_9PEZI|nr:hypothetical protein QBC35DRAFT_393424 [Podospora australis]